MSGVMDLRNALTEDEDVHIKREDRPHSPSNFYHLSNSSLHHHHHHHHSPELDMSTNTDYARDAVSPQSGYYMSPPYDMSHDVYQGSYNMSTNAPIIGDGALLEMRGGPSGVSQYGAYNDPSNTVKLTPVTGRLSRAKKGIPVHKCESCDKVFTRAEHLRRHQLSHANPRFECKYSECQRKFHRKDLLERHEQKHEIESSENPHSISPSSKGYMSHHRGGSGSGNGNGQYGRSPAATASFGVSPHVGLDTLRPNKHFNGGSSADPFPTTMINSSPSVASQPYGHPTLGFTSAASTAPLLPADYGPVGFDVFSPPDLSGSSSSSSSSSSSVGHPLSAGMSQMYGHAQLSYPQQQPHQDQFCQPRSYDMLQPSFAAGAYGVPEYNEMVGVSMGYNGVAPELMPEDMDASFGVAAYPAGHYMHSVS